MHQLLTPKQVAQAIGVSEASLKRWCDQGRLPASRTAGGHRRIPVSGVLQWLRQSGHRLVRPDVLGLPSNTGWAKSSFGRSAGLLAEALARGDEAASRQIIINLYMAGDSAVDIIDGVIGPTFISLGSAWQHGEIEIYQERRGCEICMGVLRELRGMLGPASDDAPRAIGGTLSADPYTLATAAAEVALLEAGWRAQSHGCGNPGFTLAAAIRDIRPDLFWLSVSTLDSEEEFLEGYEQVSLAAGECDVPVAVGGRALAPELRKRMSYAAYCDNLGHLVAFAEALSTSTPGAGRRS